MSEEGGDGEGVVSEATSLLSYTIRYVTLSVGVVITDSLLSYTLDVVL